MIKDAAVGGLSWAARVGHGDEPGASDSLFVR